VEADENQEAVAKKLRAAVLAGELTKEEAHPKLKAIKAGGEKTDKPKAKAKAKAKTGAAEVREAISQELMAAVKAGKLTKEEAKAKMKALREKEASDQGGAKKKK